MTFSALNWLIQLLTWPSDMQTSFQQLLLTCSVEHLSIITSIPHLRELYLATIGKPQEHAKSISTLPTVKRLLAPCI